MSTPQISQVEKATVDAEQNEANTADLSLESLILLINAQRLKNLQTKTEAEFKTLKERQAAVAELHKIMDAINAATDENGALDITKNDNLKALMEKAKAHGVTAKEGQVVFNRDERDRLMENFRMKVGDLEIENDMQLQTISRYTNERYESYQLARSILKPLQDAKTSLAKALRG